jgi:imidazolonepropionase-like amidohydrolase
MVGLSLALLVLAANTSTPPAIAFVDVAVVPGDSDRLLAHQTVVVRDGLITAIGPAAAVKLPAGTTRIAGAGKYLMPGMADMHGHLWREGWPDSTLQLSLALFLANGVTTVREMWGTPRQLAMRDRIERGEVLGPRLFVYGPALNRESAPTPAVGVQKVQEQARDGYDGIKIHEGLDRPTYDAVTAAAKQAKLPFAGHVPNAVGLAAALAAGQKSIEHLDGYVEALAGDDLAGEAFAGPHPPPSENSIFLVLKPALLAKVDERRLPALIAATRQSGAANVPTLNHVRALYNDVDLEALTRLPELKYWPPVLVQRWTDAQRQQKPRPPADLMRLRALRERLLLDLAAAGAPILIGSDAPGTFGVPGFSLRREAEAMVKAGLTPAQVIRAATFEAARYFGREHDCGSVAVGKRADLVLADGNPLQDVVRAFHPVGVMVKGRWLPREELNGMLASIERDLRYPIGAEIKDLPITATNAATLTGSYAFPAPTHATITVTFENDALMGSCTEKGCKRPRLRWQGGDVFLIPEEKLLVTFEKKAGRAAVMRLSSPGWIDWRAPRVP